jgi:SAM-dependent methyltransferase
VVGNRLLTHKPGQGLAPEQGFALSDALESGLRIPSGAAELGAPELGASPDSFIAAEQAPSVTQRVKRFYKQLPFNFYSNSIDFAKQILRRNRIREYPALHSHLRRHRDLRVLDVGSGAGWFVNSCAHFYGHAVTGLEINPRAIQQSRAVARLMPVGGSTEFVCGDIFEQSWDPLFDVVNSLGVLHHTADCQAAVERAASWVRPGGFFHLGLYHSYGRRPFLDHFARLRREGASYSQMFEAFRELAPDASDDVHLESWFRDQVLHPHETQHSFEEISALLERLGFRVRAVSLNGFRPKLDRSALIALEKTFEAKAETALRAKRYFPGYFVVWAENEGRAPGQS